MFEFCFVNRNEILCIQELPMLKRLGPEYRSLLCQISNIDIQNIEQQGKQFWTASNRAIRAESSGTMIYKM